MRFKAWAGLYEAGRGLRMHSPEETRCAEVRPRARRHCLLKANRAWAKAEVPDTPFGVLSSRSCGCQGKRPNSLIPLGRAGFVDVAAGRVDSHGHGHLRNRELIDGFHAQIFERYTA